MVNKKDTTIAVSKGARDRLAFLAKDAEVSLGEVFESLSYARMPDLLRCLARRAATEAHINGIFDAAQAGAVVPPQADVGTDA